jgi:hypothetical protein
MWNWRIVIIVPAASKEVAEQAARAINSTGPNYDGEAFALPLSASGAGQATHYALYTSATDSMVQAMSVALPNVGGAMFWRHDTDSRLVASNVTEPEGQEWGLPQSLAAAGMQVVDTPLG